MQEHSLAVMQPYFCPYLAYFQLIHSVQTFVIYDNIEYTKKGWINRNRYLKNAGDGTFTLPLKKDSDFRDVRDRYLADVFPSERKKILAQLSSAYRKAPFYNDTIKLVESLFNHDDRNLFGFVLNSVQTLCDALSIRTPIIESSAVGIDHALKGEQKVLAICGALEATTYVNPIGGKDLYDKSRFHDGGIDLLFLQSRDIRYPQLGNEFVPRLSIIDVLMFNDMDTVGQLINAYTLA